MRALLLANVAATLGMVAVIWFVQLVHYPLFADVGEEGFARYEARHKARISWIVVPLMLAELGTAVALVFVDAAFAPAWERWLGLACALAAWAVTFLLSVPEHGRLALGYDAAALRRLVTTNWLRTAAWTGHGGLVLLWLHRALG